MLWQRISIAEEFAEDCIQCFTLYNYEEHVLFVSNQIYY
jgi:hypothetical protein